MNPFQLALINLKRRRDSTLVAVIAIALSIMSSGVLLRLYLLSGQRFSTLAHGVDAVVGAKSGGLEILLGSLNGEGDYPDYLPYVLFRSLRQGQTVQFEDGAQSTPDFIRKVTPFLYAAQADGARVVGTDETFIKTEADENRPALSSGRWASKPLEVVLGANWARNHSSSLGDTVSIHTWLGQTVSNDDYKLTVVGILGSTGSVWDQMLFISVQQAQDFLRLQDVSHRTIWGVEVLHYFLVNLKPGGFEHLESLINRRTVGQVVRVDEEIKRLQDLTGTGRRLGFLISAMIVLLGGLVVCAMLLARFDGMTMQLAVLRAMGYRKKFIFSWLVLEGITLGVAACILGACLDALSFPFFRTLLGSALPSPSLAQSSIFLSAPVWAASLIAVVLSIAVPAFKLSTRDAHQALRGL